ncbi:MAG: DUF2066 domain-containing protein [Rhodospirillales bacterium]
MAADSRLALVSAIAACLFALGAACPAPAQAQGDDVYTVRGVQVDATAESAAAARAKALIDGQRRALLRVFERVALTEDAARLPRPNDRGVESLVQALEVDRERTSKVRYLAELTVRFKPDALRELLRQSQVRFAETRGRPMLLLPVYEDGATAMLWDDANPWRKAWNAVPTGDGLISVIVPIGDLTDSEAIDARAAIEGDTEKLGAIAARYRAGEVIVAAARLVENPDTKAQSIELFTVRHGSAQDSVTPPAPSAPAAAMPLDTPVAIEQRLTAAARGLARRIEDDWKRANLMSFDGQQQQLLLSLPLQGIGDLVEARRRLAELPSVQRVDVTALTPRVARLMLTFSGGTPQLQAALAEKDMTLIPQPPDWTLTVADAKAKPPAAEAQQPLAGPAAPAAPRTQ